MRKSFAIVTIALAVLLCYISSFFAVRYSFAKGVLFQNIPDVLSGFYQTAYYPMRHICTDGFLPSGVFVDYAVLDAGSRRFGAVTYDPDLKLDVMAQLAVPKRVMVKSNLIISRFEGDAKSGEILIDEYEYIIYRVEW